MLRCLPECNCTPTALCKLTGVYRVHVHIYCRSLSQVYESEVEELHRHTIWQANKKYVDEHNAHKDMFGYTLAMNEFGDLVSVIL